MTMTKETTSFVYVTYILSTQEKVFEAITKPDVARRYWGHENVSDWNPGSKWEHIRANDERTVELVGKVIEVSPPTRLVITWANASQASDPASYSRVTFAIEEYDNMVRLTVTHDELEAGSGMAKGIKQGWPAVLSSLKSFLETGRGMRYLPRRSIHNEQFTGGRVGHEPAAIRCRCGGIHYRGDVPPFGNGVFRCVDQRDARLLLVVRVDSAAIRRNRDALDFSGHGDRGEQRMLA